MVTCSMCMPVSVKNVPPNCGTDGAHGLVNDVVMLSGISNWFPYHGDYMDINLLLKVCKLRSPPQLPCNGDQGENINPKQGNKMPIPRGDIHYDPAALNWLAQQGSSSCKEQHQNSSSQVNSMHPRQ